MQKRFGVLVVVIVAALFAGQAFALNALDPGTSLYIPGTSPSLGPPNYSTSLPSWFTSANLVTSLTSKYTVAVGDITGAITTKVYENPAMGDDLGFEYYLTSTGKSSFERVTIGGVDNPWLGHAILDAGANGSGKSTAGGTAPYWTNGDPEFISRDPNALGAGIVFQFGAAGVGTYLIGPSEYSALIWVTTDCPSYESAGVTLEDSAAISSALSYAPFPIPEPATLILLGLGGLGIIPRLRRRSRS